MTLFIWMKIDMVVMARPLWRDNFKRKQDKLSKSPSSQSYCVIFLLQAILCPSLIQFPPSRCCSTSSCRTWPLSSSCLSSIYSSIHHMLIVYHFWKPAAYKSILHCNTQVTWCWIGSSSATIEKLATRNISCNVFPLNGIMNGRKLVENRINLTMKYHYNFTFF